MSAGKGSAHRRSGSIFPELRLILTRIIHCGRYLMPRVEVFWPIDNRRENILYRRNKIDASRINSKFKG